MNKSYTFFPLLALSVYPLIIPSAVYAESKSTWEKYSDRVNLREAAYCLDFLREGHPLKERKSAIDKAYVEAFEYNLTKKQFRNQFNIDNNSAKEALQIHVGQDTIHTFCTRRLKEAWELVREYTGIDYGSDPMARKPESPALNADECLNARDYEGCMRVKSKGSNTLDSDCKPNEFCIATKGKDPLGFEKIEGWQMKYIPEGNAVIYVRSDPRKVLVRGEQDRYIEITAILRQYRNPQAGTRGYSNNSTSTDTNCYSFGNDLNCTSTSTPGFSIQGRPANPGGVIQSTHVSVIDCEEKTIGRHLDGSIVGKWDKFSSSPDREAVQVAGEFCPVRKTLKLSTFRKYAD